MAGILIHVCAGIRVLKGFNDLLTKCPRVAQEAHLWDPSLFTVTSSKKMPFKCANCQFIWSTEIKCRTTRNFTDCPNCAISGFKKNRISYVYLIEKQNLRKIGIGNKSSNRLENHVKNGWHIVDTIENISGYEASKIENKILKYISGMNIPMGIHATNEKFNGFSECWLKEYCQDTKINNLLEQAEKLV